MADQEQGFVVRDRRASGGSDVPPVSAPDKKQPVLSPAQEATPPQDASTHEAPSLPVTFSSFVISLGSSSLMLMGERLDPQQQPM
ncbi:MAG: DUF1844 domain-containing protein, partial [Nitrospira sp.]|nr:DUF1844 domain-containing protein [Nitrospira sp.]